MRILIFLRLKLPEQIYFPQLTIPFKSRNNWLWKVIYNNSNIKLLDISENFNSIENTYKWNVNVKLKHNIKYKINAYKEGWEELY